MLKVDAILIHFLWSYPEDRRRQLFVELIPTNTVCDISFKNVGTFLEND